VLNSKVSDVKQVVSVTQEKTSNHSKTTTTKQQNGVTVELSPNTKTNDLTNLQANAPTQHFAPTPFPTKLPMAKP
jgi:hypothetical protein